MQGQRGRNERRAGVFLDMAHLILGIAIVIFAVLSFISPEGNRMLFPLVFLLAALLNGIKGIFELKTCARDKKRFRLGNLPAASWSRSWASWRVKRRKSMVSRIDDGREE